MDELTSKIKKLCSMETPRNKPNVKSFKKLMTGLVDQGMDKEQLNKIFRCHVGKLDHETTKWLVEEKGACVHPDSSLLAERLNDYDSVLQAESWSFQAVPLMDAILDLNVSKVEFLLKQGAKVIINYTEIGGCGEESTLNLLCSTIHQRFLARRRNRNRDRDILLNVARLLVRYHPSSAGICETLNIMCRLDPMECALGLQLDHSDPYWKTSKADYDILKLLLDNGCSINGGSKWEQSDADFTPMHAALSQGDIELVEFIVNYEGFNPNQIFWTVHSNYVIHCFSEDVDFNLLEILLDKGANPMPGWRSLNARNDNTDVTVVTKFPDRHRLLNRLFKWLIRSDYNTESIISYFENASPEIFKRVTERDCMWVDSLDALQLSALATFGDNSRVDIMMWILDRKFDPNILNEEGQTPLIEMAANIGQVSDIPSEVLEEALSGIVFQMVILNKIRLAHKMPNPSLIMGQGTSPHDLQRRMRDLNLVDLSIKDVHGKSLRDYAVEKSLTEVMKHLNLESQVHISLRRQ